MANHERELRQAIKRLEKSKGALSRRRARQHLHNTLNKISRDLRKEYPGLRADGSAIEPRKFTGVACPQCGVPFKGYVPLAEHLISKHLLHTDNWAVCWCGKDFTSEVHRSSKGVRRVHTAEQLARHLAGLKDLKAHMTAGLLANVNTP